MVGFKYPSRLVIHLIESECSRFTGRCLENIYIVEDPDATEEKQPDVSELSYSSLWGANKV